MVEEFTECRGCKKKIKSDWKVFPYCATPVPMDVNRVAGVILLNVVRGKVEELGEKLTRMEHITDVYAVTGDADFYIKIAADGVLELRRLIMNLGEHPEITDTRTYMILSSEKEVVRMGKDTKDVVRSILLFKYDMTKEKEIIKYMKSQQSIDEIYSVTGDADLTIKARFPNYGYMKKFILNMPKAVEGITDQKTYMAVRIFKEFNKKVEIPEYEAEKIDIEELPIRMPRSENDVYLTLTNLPRGIPSTLWGLDVEELVREIMKAEYGLTPRGFPVINIKGKWYRGDLDDPSTYLQPYEGKVIKYRKSGD